MRYVVRNNFFGLELQNGAQDQQVSKDEQAEGQRVFPSLGDGVASDGVSSDNSQHLERKEAVAGNKDCVKEPHGDQLCAELLGEHASPQSGSEEPINKDGHITHSLNMYEDEIWEGPGTDV